jgi:eukaryotic-like serine/threonine-protein kinase
MERGFAIPPDGRSLVFFATAPGKKGLWVRPMHATTARLLPGTEDGTRPFWSPDSRSIGYRAAGKLWRVDVSGGAPIAICDTSMLVGGAWAPDGHIVFAEGSGLRRVAASGGTPEPLTFPDASRGETAHRWPQVLSGGWILFQVVANPEQAGIYAMRWVPSGRANPREAVRLVSTDGNGVYAAGHLLWLRGTTLVAQPFDPERLKLSVEPRPIADSVGASRLSRMAAAASSGGLLVHHGPSDEAQLAWLDREGKAVGTLGQPVSYGTLSISPDGGRVVVSRGFGSRRDLWMVDVKRDAWSRFTFLPGIAWFPVWSPDGRQVMFSAGTPFNLYRKEANGAGNEQRVTDSPNLQLPTDWSRDGRLVLYQERARDTNYDLWVLPVTPDGKPEAGAKPRLYLRTPFNEASGRFSPEPNPRWWRTRRKSRAGRRSTFRRSRSRGASTRSRPAAACFRHGVLTAGSYIMCHPATS